MASTLVCSSSLGLRSGVLKIWVLLFEVRVEVSEAACKLKIRVVSCIAASSWAVQWLFGCVVGMAVGSSAYDLLLKWVWVCSVRERKWVWVCSVRESFAQHALTCRTVHLLPATACFQ